jgi:hypothetical protein
VAKGQTIVKQSKTQERPEKETGKYFKPSLGKNVCRMPILSISACAAIRGLAKAGFSIQQCAKMADLAKANLNERTVSSHVRLGRSGSVKYGAIPELSRNQIVLAAKMVGEPGSTEAVEKKVLAKAKSKSKKKAPKLTLVESEPVTAELAEPTHEESEVEKVRGAVDSAPK